MWPAVTSKTSESSYVELPLFHFSYSTSFLATKKLVFVTKIKAYMGNMDHATKYNDVAKLNFVGSFYDCLPNVKILDGSLSVFCGLHIIPYFHN